MGCGKSKHDVVAATISQSKKPYGDNETNNTKTVKIIPEKAVNYNVSNGNGSLGVVDNVKGSENVKVDTEGENIIKESENMVSEKVGDDDKGKVGVKEEDHEVKDLKGENVDESKKEKVSEVEGQGQGQEKLISANSLNDFQEDGTIEGIRSEGISGKTAYYSPANNKVESPKLDNNVIAKENAPVEETTAETKIEEIPVKEQVVPTAEEAEVSKQIPVKEEIVPITESEKVPIASEEIVAETKEDEPKTN